MCYGSTKPTAPPELPIVDDFNAAYHQPLAGDLNQSLGILTLDSLPCIEIAPGQVAIKVDLLIPLDKNGDPVSGNYAVLVTDTTAPFTCTGGTPTFGALTLTPLLQSHDEDGDGCSDWEELGQGPTAGGLRDPFNPWDFYDTPLITVSNRDKVVNISDNARVVARFGSHDSGGTASPNRYDDPLTTPLNAAPAYHPALDRGAALGPNAWNLSQADGVINISDVSRMVAQFGTNCLNPP